MKFGTGGRGILRGDGIANIDMSLLKKIRFGDGRDFQMRVEMFNIFNHAEFGLPGRSFGGPGFGIVSGTSTAARQVQIGLRLIF